MRDVNTFILGVGIIHASVLERGGLYVFNYSTLK